MAVSLAIWTGIWVWLLIHINDVLHDDDFLWSTSFRTGVLVYATFVISMVPFVGLYMITDTYYVLLLFVLLYVAAGQASSKKSLFIVVV